MGLLPLQVWRLSEENFMESYRDQIGDPKLRFVWCIGNQNVANYSYQTVYRCIPIHMFSITKPYREQDLHMVINLTWEKSGNLNVV